MHMQMKWNKKIISTIYDKKLQTRFLKKNGAPLSLKFTANVSGTRERRYYRRIPEYPPSWTAWPTLWRHMYSNWHLQASRLFLKTIFFWYYFYFSVVALLSSNDQIDLIKAFDNNTSLKSKLIYSPSCLNLLAIQSRFTHKIRDWNQHFSSKKMLLAFIFFQYKTWIL